MSRNLLAGLKRPANREHFIFVRKPAKLKDEKNGAAILFNLECSLTIHNLLFSWFTHCDWINEGAVSIARYLKYAPFVVNIDDRLLIHYLFSRKEGESLIVNKDKHLLKTSSVFICINKQEIVLLYVFLHDGTLL